MSLGESFLFKSPESIWPGVYVQELCIWVTWFVFIFWGISTLNSIVFYTKNKWWCSNGQIQWDNWISSSPLKLWEHRGRGGRKIARVRCFKTTTKLWFLFTNRAIVHMSSYQVQHLKNLCKIKPVNIPALVGHGYWQLKCSKEKKVLFRVEDPSRLCMLSWVALLANTYSQTNFIH